MDIDRLHGGDTVRGRQAVESLHHEVREREEDSADQPAGERHDNGQENEYIVEHRGLATIAAFPDASRSDRAGKIGEIAGFPAQRALHAIGQAGVTAVEHRREEVVQQPDDIRRHPFRFQRGLVVLSADLGEANLPPVASAISATASAKVSKLGPVNS